MVPFRPILVVLFLLSHSLYGQGLLTISGVVRSENNENLPNATIFLINHADTLQTLSGSEGKFSFRTRAAASIELAITMEGFKTYHQALNLETNQSQAILPPIILAPAYDELNPAIVSPVKPISILEDTTDYHAAAYKLRPGDELERLMKQLPGIDWDSKGNLLAKGKIITRVMINGQDFTGGDLGTALEKIPADIIDKVEVIDDYGDNARLTGVRSGEAEKVLNIVLKEDKSHGETTNVNVGAGNKDRYDNEAFAQLFDGSRQWTVNGKLANASSSGDLKERLFELGYSDKLGAKWMDNAQFSLWGDSHSSATGLSQTNNYDSSQQQLLQNSQLSGGNQNELLRYFQKYTPGPDLLLQAGTFLGIYNNRESAITNEMTSELDSGFNKIATSNIANTSYYNSLTTGANILFEKQFPITGQKLSVLTSYRYLTKDSHQEDCTQSTILSDSLFSNPLQHYYIRTLNARKEWTAKLNYYFPLGKASLLGLGYSWNNSITQNNLVTQSPDSTKGALITIDSLSSDYIFTTNTNSFHMGYLFQTGKLNLTTGLDAQPWSLNGETSGQRTGQEYRYFNLLPLIEWMYTFSANRKLRIEYKGAPVAPTIQQLQPVVNLTNTQYPVQGNPALRPSYTQSFTLEYDQSWFKGNRYWGFSVDLNYKTTRDMIISNLVQPHDTGTIIQETYFVNANGFNTLGAIYRLDLPGFLHNRIRISLLGNITDTRDLIMTNNIGYQGYGLVWNQGIQVELRIPDLTESEISGWYTRTTTQYSTGMPSSMYPAFIWSYHLRQNCMQKWLLDAFISQPFTAATEHSLQANPAIINISLGRDIFRNNQGRISLSVNDVLNSATGISQSVTPTGMMLSRTSLVGRYYQISMIIKLEQFRTFGRK